MELYQIIDEMLSVPQILWKDKRHKACLIWILVGMIQSTSCHVDKWIDYMRSKAQHASSLKQRSLAWLHNSRIQTQGIVAALMSHSLSQWEGVLYIALDTSIVREGMYLISLGVVYRGRVIPIVQEIIEHNSASISFSHYQSLLDKASGYLPWHVKIVLLADRGFADTKLMNYVKNTLGWSYRIRIKNNLTLHRRGKKSIKLAQVGLRPGEALFWHHVYLTHQGLAVHLALAYSTKGERWLIVSDEPTSLETFTEYGYRFSIEETFLDLKSACFQLEASRLSSAQAISKLVDVMAIAMLILVSQGTHVVKDGKRRIVDSHYFRGLSYLNIGLKWFRRWFSEDYRCVPYRRLQLVHGPDPEPCRASKQTIPKAVFTWVQTTVYECFVHCGAWRSPSYVRV